MSVSPNSSNLPVCPDVDVAEINTSDIQSQQTTNIPAEYTQPVDLPLITCTLNEAKASNKLHSEKFNRKRKAADPHKCPKRRRRRRRKPEVPPLFPELLRNLPPPTHLQPKSKYGARTTEECGTNTSSQRRPTDLVGQVKRRVFDEEGNVVEVQVYTEEELSGYGVCDNAPGDRNAFLGNHKKRSKMFKSQGSYGVSAGLLSSSSVLEGEEEVPEATDDEPAASLEDVKKQRRVARANQRRQKQLSKKNPYCDKQQTAPAEREKSCYITQIRTSEQNIAIFSRYSLLELYATGTFDILTGQPTGILPPLDNQDEVVTESATTLTPSTETNQEPPEVTKPLTTWDAFLVSLQTNPLGRLPQDGDVLMFKMLELNVDSFTPEVSAFKVFHVVHFDQADEMLKGVFLQEPQQLHQLPANHDDSQLESFHLKELLEVHSIQLSPLESC